MQYKTFYLIVLFGTSLLSGIYLTYLWLKRKDTTNLFLKESNIALLLIAFTFFHRALIAGNKLFDIQDFNLDYIVIDRMISSISNLVYLSCLSFFPLLSEENKFTRIIKQRERWFAIVFFIIISLISIFTFLDKMYISFGTISRVIIVLLDAFVSITCILLLGYIMKLSLSGFKLSSIVLNFVMVTFVLFSTTQIILPLSKVLPEVLMSYYPYFLAIFLIFYFGFIISFFMYFLSLEYVVTEIQQEEDRSVSSTNNHTSELKAIGINSIEIGFMNKLSSYLTVELLLNNNEVYKVTIMNTKVLHPFLYWILFAVAKKNDVNLFNLDIAVAKFRMIEYFNKYSQHKISQDLLFLNDNGEYSLLLLPNQITIHDKEIIFSKKTFIEIILKYAECFLSIYYSNKKSSPKLKSEKIRDLKENIDAFLAKLTTRL